MWDIHGCDTLINTRMSRISIYLNELQRSHLINLLIVWLCDYAIKRDVYTDSQFTPPSSSYSSKGITHLTVNYFAVTHHYKIYKEITLVQFFASNIFHLNNLFLYTTYTYLILTIYCPYFHLYLSPFSIFIASSLLWRFVY